MRRYRLYNCFGKIVSSADDLMALINNNWETIKSDPKGYRIDFTEVGFDPTPGVVKYDPVLPGVVISFEYRKA